MARERTWTELERCVVAIDSENIAFLCLLKDNDTLLLNELVC